MLVNILKTIYIPRFFILNLFSVHLCVINLNYCVDRICYQLQLKDTPPHSRRMQMQTIAKAATEEQVTCCPLPSPSVRMSYPIFLA